MISGHQSHRGELSVASYVKQKNGVVADEPSYKDFLAFKNSEDRSRLSVNSSEKSKAVNQMDGMSQGSKVNHLGINSSEDGDDYVTHKQVEGPPSRFHSRFSSQPKGAAVFKSTMDKDGTG
jgi:hypothetical protein